MVPRGALAKLLQETVGNVLDREVRHRVGSTLEPFWSHSATNVNGGGGELNCAHLVAGLFCMHAKSNRIIVTVIGADTVGIIANVSAVLAEARANIIDISQTTVREFFAMIMLADLESATVPFDELKRRLDAKGAAMGLRIDAQHEDVFKFMHRV